MTRNPWASWMKRLRRGRVLRLMPGDVLLVTIEYGTQEEIADAMEALQPMLPNGVKAIATSERYSFSVARSDA